MHTFVRLNGYGVAIAPHAPFVVRRVGDGLDGVIAIDHLNTRQFFAPGREVDLEQVADVSEGEPHEEWLLELGGLRLPWPNRFSVVSSDLDGVPFELWGASGANVHLQGPFRPPPTHDQLITEGQSVVAEGEGWVELGYEVDGEAWRQRHVITPQGFLVTGQDLLDHDEGARDIATDLASRLR